MVGPVSSIYYLHTMARPGVGSNSKLFRSTNSTIGLYMAKKKVMELMDSSSESEDDDCLCLVCMDKYLHQQ